MRARKRVLLIDSNEVRQSTLRYLLDLKGYRVLSASTKDEAVQILDVDHVECIVLRDRARCHELKDLSEALKTARCKRSAGIEHAPILFVSAFADRREDDPYFDQVIWSNAPTTDLMATLKVMVARKRGPAKKPVGSVIPEQFRVKDWSAA